MPSLLKSPTATEMGFVPAPKLLPLPKLGEGQETLHRFSSTDTLLELKLAVARSCLPSALKSPTATDTGPLPTGKLMAAPNVPVPVPSRIDTLEELALATARSCLPSALKSPTATE